jgi:hypothetical protein
VHPPRPFAPLGDRFGDITKTFVKNFTGNDECAQLDHSRHGSRSSL